MDNEKDQGLTLLEKNEESYFGNWEFQMVELEEVKTPEPKEPAPKPAVKTLFAFDSSKLNSVQGIHEILGKAYKETGRKFSVNFNGSKGYLTNIELTAEGNQNHDRNRIKPPPVKGKDSIKIILLKFCPIEGVELEILDKV